MQLSGNTVPITGGTTGIGYAMAEAFLDGGPASSLEAPIILTGLSVSLLARNKNSAIDAKGVWVGGIDGPAKRCLRNRLRNDGRTNPSLPSPSRLSVLPQPTTLLASSRVGTLMTHVRAPAAHGRNQHHRPPVISR